MANNYKRWNTPINPTVGVLTNTFVNYYEGISVTQTVPSGIHVLTDSFVGKKFHINNEGSSTSDFIIRVTTQNGAETFPIAPGDSGIFVYSGSGLWDQVGGEQVINQIGAGLGSVSAQDQISITIDFSDMPDLLPAKYNIGNVPVGYSVSDIAIDVTQPFDDGICDNVRINSTVGPTTIMQQADSDIKLTGNYTITHPAISDPVGGQLQAVFNALPSGSGATQGKLTILVEFLAI